MRDGHTPRDGAGRAPRSPLPPAWGAAVRIIFSPVVRHFKAVLPCLHAPWPPLGKESAAEAVLRDATRLKRSDSDLRGRICPCEGKACSETARHH